MGATHVIFLSKPSYIEFRNFVLTKSLGWQSDKGFLNNQNGPEATAGTRMCASLGIVLSLTPIQTLAAVVIAALTIFIGFYLAYAIFCVIVIKKNKKRLTHKRTGELPTVSLIIPVYNEASTLAQKFANIERLNYRSANLEIVFVDGGSEDTSAELIDAYIKEHNKLRWLLVREGKRTGFNSGVIAGLKASTGEIICITGAETEYSPDALQALINAFSNPRIGAVSGRMVVKNTTGFSSRLEASYRRLYDLIREAESYVDSPFDVKGEISAVRRDICGHILNKQSIARKGNIDCCFVFQSKEDGYRGTYEPNAVYAETAPSSVKDSFQQQTRRAATLMENLLLYKNLLFNASMGYFGVLIMPAHLAMLMILPSLFVVSVFGIIALVCLQPLNLLYTSILLVGVILLLASPYAQAFAKTQFSMFTAAIGLLLGLETQKFPRLDSARETTEKPTSDVQRS